MVDFPLLSVMTFLPLIGALFILLARGEEGIVAKNAKFGALYTSLITFALSLYLLFYFDPEDGGYQFLEVVTWLPSLGLKYTLGIDGISLFFVILSTALTPICILASWQSVHKRVKEYMVAFLVLETLMIGTFLSLDIFLFYIFFEAVLIPMFIIIGVWGGQRRVYAAFKFFLFTLLGSVLMLIAMLYIYTMAGTSNIPDITKVVFDTDVQKWLWLAFFASFAVKMPMWPVHTWLPDAHVEAPTAGSVILAGVLLKMGGYGFLRFSLPMFPDASAYFADMVYWLSIIAIVYTSLVALVQSDMKKLIAYSSVAHMGYVTLGIFTATTQGIEGGVFQMISHGVISGALFLSVGVVYDRLHTRDISRYGALVRNMPIYATMFMVFMLGSVGLPGTSGFVGEFLVLLGAYQVDTLVGVAATMGLILGAPYMLWLYRKVIFGPVANKDASQMSDVNTYEKVCLVPLAVLTIWFGLFPGFILDRVSPSVERVIQTIESKSQQNTLQPSVINSAPTQQLLELEEIE